MKTLIAASILVLAAGCANEPTQVAKAECKVVPVTTASIAGGKPRNVTNLDMAQAEANLATSQYRFQNLRTHGLAFNNVEEALHDCR